MYILVMADHFTKCAKAYPIPRAFTDISKSDIWDYVLPRVLKAYRQESTGVTQNLVNFGKELCLSINVSLLRTEKFIIRDTISGESATCYTHSSIFGTGKLGTAQEKRNECYDSYVRNVSPYKTDDLVCLHKPTTSLRPHSKSTGSWCGSFVIIGTSQTGVYEIKWLQDPFASLNLGYSSGC